MSKTGKCKHKLKNINYLYIENVKDNIDIILQFIKKCNGIDYSYNIYDKECFMNNNFNIYSFFDEKNINSIFYIEDIEQYILYNDNYYFDFSMYTIDAFQETFELINEKRHDRNEAMESLGFDKSRNFTEEEYEVLKEIENKLDMKIGKNIYDIIEQHDKSKYIKELESDKVELLSALKKINEFVSDCFTMGLLSISDEEFEIEMMNNIYNIIQKMEMKNNNE